MSKRNNSKDVQKSYDEDILTSKDNKSDVANDSDIKKMVQDANYKDMDVHKSSSRVLKVMFWIMILLLITCTYLSIQKIEYIEQISGTNNITTEYRIMPNITFVEYRNITDPHYSKDISIIGYIVEENVQVNGIQLRNIYISDDYRVQLKLALNDKANNIYDDVVKDISVTYKIDGTYRYTLGEFKLFVANITREDKPTIQKTEIISENELQNQTREKKIINITYGLERIRIPKLI